MPHVILSLIVFLPAAGALAIACMSREREEFIKLFSFVTTVAVFLLTALLAIPSSGGSDALTFVLGRPEMQKTFTVPWIPSFHIYYAMGIDGISFPLVILTSFLSVLAMGASWPSSASRSAPFFCRSPGSRSSTCSAHTSAGCMSPSRKSSPAPPHPPASVRSGLGPRIAKTTCYRARSRY